MLSTVVIGLLVALASFGSMEFVVLKRFREHTLSCLLFAVVGGLMLAGAFAEPARSFYQLGWMLGMSASVCIGLALRSARRK